MKHSPIALAAIIAAPACVAASGSTPDEVAIRFGNDVEYRIRQGDEEGGYGFVESVGIDKELIVAWNALDVWRIRLSLRQTATDSGQVTESGYDFRQDFEERRIGMALTHHWRRDEKLSYQFGVEMMVIRQTGINLNTTHYVVMDCIMFPEQFDDCPPRIRYDERSNGVALFGGIVYQPWPFLDAFANVGHFSSPGDEFSGDTYQIGIRFQPVRNIAVELRRFDDYRTRGSTIGLIFGF